MKSTKLLTNFGGVEFPVIKSKWADKILKRNHPEILTDIIFRCSGKYMFSCFSPEAKINDLLVLHGHFVWKLNKSDWSLTFAQCCLLHCSCETHSSHLLKVWIQFYNTELYTYKCNRNDESSIQLWTVKGVLHQD